MQELKAALGEYADFEVEILGSSSPTESGLPNALYSAIEMCTKKNDPAATIIPFISSGATDSRFFREKGAVAYGFAPLQIEEPLSSHLEKMHGHNERISIKNLGYGIGLLYDIVREFCI